MSKDGIRLVIDAPTGGVNFDSCEVSNEINIVAHVEGLPFSANIENYYANIGGKSTALTCKKSEGLGGYNQIVTPTQTGNDTGNITYDSAKELFQISLNCTASIPRIQNCSKGDVHTYEPNTMTVVLSYRDGKNIPLVKAVEAPLPSITITQTIKTMHDIMEEAKNKMEDVLQRMQDLAEEMIQKLEDCIDMLITAMYISMFLTIVGMVGGFIAGGIAGGDKTAISKTDGSVLTPEQIKTQNLKVNQDFTYQGSSFNWETAGQASQSTTQAATSLGQTFISGIQAMCNILQSLYNIQMSKLELQIKIIEMQTCVQVNQNRLDRGLCRGQEDSCMNQIGSCIGIGTSAIQTFTNDAESEMRTMTGSTDKFLTQAQDAATRLGTAFDYYGNVAYSNVLLQVRWGDTLKPGNPGGDVCTYSGKQTVHGSGTPQCKPSKIKFLVDNIQSGVCKGTLKVMLNNAAAFPINSELSASQVATSIGVGQGSKGQVTSAKLFCDKNGDNAIGTGEYTDKSFPSFYLYHAEDGDCDCEKVKGITTHGEDGDSDTYPHGKISISSNNQECVDATDNSLIIYASVTQLPAGYSCDDYKLRIATIDGNILESVLYSSGDNTCSDQSPPVTGTDVGEVVVWITIPTKTGEEERYQETEFKRRECEKKID